MRALRRVRLVVGVTRVCTTWELPLRAAMPLSPSRRLLLAADQRTVGFDREATRTRLLAVALAVGQLLPIPVFIVLRINAVTTNARLEHHQRTGGAVARLARAIATVAVWLVIGFGGSTTVGAFLSKR